jgi:hypothetical protein
VRFPRAAARHCRTAGGFGKTRPAGTMTGLRVQARWTGTAKARVIPAVRQGSPFVSGSGFAKCAIFRTIGTRARLRPRKCVAEAERWRSVAAASAVVERRQASCPLPFPHPACGEGKGGGSAAPQGAEVTEQRLSAFRFLFFFSFLFLRRTRS